MSITEVTVGYYRRFINATGRETRAQRRGYSMAYDERSGPFARVSGVDWRSDYACAPAAEDLPVLPVSARDVEAYPPCPHEPRGTPSRTPSCAAFDYALRASRPTHHPLRSRPTPPPHGTPPAP